MRRVGAADRASVGSAGDKRIGEPRVPALRPVRGGELFIRPDVHVSLELAHGDGVTELRAGARNARLEATDPIAGPAIAARLIVKVAHQAEIGRASCRERGWR